MDHKWTTVCFALAILIPVGCSSGSASNTSGANSSSGVDGTKSLGALSTQERTTYCEWATTQLQDYGSGAQAQCATSDGGVVTYQATSNLLVEVSSCVSVAQPACTVTQAEQCVTATKADLCVYLRSVSRKEPCADCLSTILVVPPPNWVGEL